MEANVDSALVDEGGHLEDVGLGLEKGHGEALLGEADGRGAPKDPAADDENRS